MFTVAWSDEARDQLAEIWWNSDSSARREITSYVAEIERNLRANADRIGESREPVIRVLADVTLGIAFQVSEPDRFVFIFRVWRIRRTR